MAEVSHIENRDEDSEEVGEEVGGEAGEDFVKVPRTPSNIHELYARVQTLTFSDLASCCVLEKEAFEKPEERCSDEKFEYRLKTCGYLSLGVFSTQTPGSLTAATFDTSRLVETGRENGEVGVLLAHIVATKSKDVFVTDEAMDYPRDWKSDHPTPSPKGHQEEGRTVCLHSLAVLPNLQKLGIGRSLLASYIERMESAGFVDRISLIAHEHLVTFYESFGFKNKGPSQAEFGGGNWINMVYNIPQKPTRVRYEAGVLPERVPSLWCHML